MAGVQVRHPVSDTAALVMLWANQYYQHNPLIMAYLQRLDLESGRSLFQHYNCICPWYSEVIINRKHFISNTVRSMVNSTPGKVTILNLGAGFSPLALELSDLLTTNCHFIEIDENGMGLKQALYPDLVPDRCGFISSIEADITDGPSLERALAHDNVGHLIVIMEGLTYYISREEMVGVLSNLSGISRQQSIVFEHLKPCRLIREERQFIPGKIFSHVRDYTALDRMTTYSEKEIRDILPVGFTCSYYDMDVMEKRRTGACSYFVTPDSGWLSVSVAVRD
ncbi:MAG: class I SAM-dependent methyltransferase [Methanomicrobiales archaeon]|nr:class I SAM-dependent methyltransferase [Methanomicrobiales archaeon]